MYEFDEVFDMIKEWIKMNWKALAICSAMVIHITVFIGILAANNSKEAPQSLIYEQTPSPQSQIEEYTPGPVETTVETPAVAPEGDSVNTATRDIYDIGVQTGVAIIETRDAIVNFWHGFDEATGAADWARTRWDNGLERINMWLEEDEIYEGDQFVPEEDEPQYDDNERQDDD